ncbi:hypothetical protein QBC37DRAFT_428811 [Rhypophila decipiens]|uniref:Uncharacterized protein n=1 Tax=Rhypophila decipiens TaxID=261697 RepID=A0AAN6Y0Z8_9PEZI|nr:hypothetical protein QBC37DRAFT_428811 [Rhypophila decipiens]
MAAAVPVMVSLMVAMAALMVRTMVIMVPFVAPIVVPGGIRGRFPIRIPLVISESTITFWSMRSRTHGQVFPDAGTYSPLVNGIRERVSTAKTGIVVPRSAVHTSIRFFLFDWRNIVLWVKFSRAFF